MSDNKEQDKNGMQELLKEDYYYMCSIHNIPYPKGSSCPACSAGTFSEKEEQPTEDE